MLDEHVKALTASEDFYVSIYEAQSSSIMITYVRQYASFSRYP